MKTFKWMAVALVAVLGLSSCDHDCDWLDVDYSTELAGTWTCITENYAEALVIKSDGSVFSYGVKDGKSWKNAKGVVKASKNKMTLIIEEGYDFEGRFEIIPGEAFSIFNANGNRLVYRYCANDLADEVPGMWICNDATSAADEDMLIQTFSTEGTVTMTGLIPGSGEFVLDGKMDYNVVGDLMFYDLNETDAAACQLIYTPNATVLGDILTFREKYSDGGKVMEEVASFLRVSQSLSLAGKKYNYSSSYISNAKGADKDIAFLDTKFNFAKMDGSIIDKFLRSVLFGVQFPDAGTFQYNCALEGQNVALQLPIEVEGNKVTIKMSTRHASYRDIVVYAFQDANCSQFHMYMPTTTFENFFSNLSLSILSASGQVNINNPVHVDAIYQEVANAIESINVSIVMKAVK